MYKKYFRLLGIASVQRALQPTLFSADEMKIVVNMEGHVLFFGPIRFSEIVIWLMHVFSLRKIRQIAPLFGNSCNSQYSQFGVSSKLFLNFGKGDF